MRMRFAASLRFVTATCGLALAFAAPPQHSVPLVVVLGYDHGPFKAGERIPLQRIRDGHAAGPDRCGEDHYHSSPCGGPSTPGIMICNADGETFGPFPDQNPCFCGHGVLDRLRADIEVVSIEVPEFIASGGRAVVKATIRNNGPDDIDTLEIVYALFTVGTEGRPIFVGPIGMPGLRAGETRDLEPYRFPDVNPAFRELKVLVANEVNNSEARGVRDCFKLDEVGIGVPDPNAANNILSGEFIVIPRSFGSSPRPVEDFVIPPKGPLNEFRIVTRLETGDLGITTILSEESRIEHAILRGDGTGGFAPTPFEVATNTIDNGRSHFGDLNDDDRIDLIYPDGDSASVVLGAANGGAGRTRSFPAGGTPLGFGIGDFTRDERADIFVSLLRQTGGGVAILEGNGRGGFDTPFVTPLPGNPVSVISADFDGNGVLDLAAALSGEPVDSLGHVAVLLGDGEGGFAQSAIGAVGVRPVGIAVGDFNTDGFLDLVTANAGSNSISLLLGDGAGGFAPCVDFAVGASPVDLAVGDFNANGSLDVAVACDGSDRLSLLLGDGTGELFGLPVQIGSGQTSVAALDANGDGRLDLAVGTRPTGDQLGAGERAALRILLNDAEPVARPRVTGVEIVGTKTLAVTGEGFDEGATVLVDGVRQKTAADAASHATRLVAKRGARKIASGQTVVVQVESAAGVLSEWALYTRL